MSDEVKCLLTISDFLYLLFIIEMMFIQHKDYLKKGMIWHVILFCILSE